MASVNIVLTDTENNILTAHAKLTNTTVSSLISMNGLANAINQAINKEIDSEVTEKSISQDVIDLVVEDRWLLINKVNQAFTNGNGPASVLTKIIARAADYTPPVVETTTP